MAPVAGKLQAADVGSGLVQPGDQLMIEGKFIRSKLGLGIFEAVARVDGKVVAQAEMMCAYRPVAPKTSDAGKQA